MLKKFFTYLSILCLVVASFSVDIFAATRKNHQKVQRGQRQVHEKVVSKSVLQQVIVVRRQVLVGPHQVLVGPHQVQDEVQFLHVRQ